MFYLDFQIDKFVYVLKIIPSVTYEKLRLFKGGAVKENPIGLS